MEDLGYETHNTFKNLSTIAVVLIYWMFKVAIIGLLWLYTLMTGGQYGCVETRQYLSK